VDGNLENAIVGLAQSRNRLEDRRGKDDEMSRGVWKVMETDLGKIRVAETERRRGKRRSRKEMRGARKEKEAKKRENGRGKKDSGRMGNMGQGRRSGKIGEESKNIGPRKISLVD